jgi:hypothetical protein
MRILFNKIILFKINKLNYTTMKNIELIDNFEDRKLTLFIRIKNYFYLKRESLLQYTLIIGFFGLIVFIIIYLFLVKNF